MSIEVIGAGFGRTGTLSLKFALEKLSFDKCYHMMEVRNHPSHVELWRSAARGDFPDWPELFDGYQATVDWPSCNFWREQMEHYPDAKVILTLRDPESWYESVMNTIWNISKERKLVGKSADQETSSMAFEVIWDGIFDGRMDDKAYVIEKFESHNARVKKEVPKHKLLVFEASDGWRPLCDFLDRPLPNVEYPKVNSTAEFVSRWKEPAGKEKLG
jgi:hypothetical protein